MDNHPLGERIKINLRVDDVTAERPPIVYKEHPMTRLLCLDFDGVIHGYQSGWEGANVANDPPVPGALTFIADVLAARDQWTLCISSSRSKEDGGINCMQMYLLKHLTEFFVKHASVSTDEAISMATLAVGRIQFPTSKPPAFLTIDDRAVCFTGVFPDLALLANFQPWYKVYKHGHDTGQVQEAAGGQRGAHPGETGNAG